MTLRTGRSRTSTRRVTLATLTCAVGLAVPLLWAGPAVARPDLPAVTPLTIAQADRAAADAGQALRGAVEARTRAAAEADAAAAAVATTREALEEARLRTTDAAASVDRAAAERAAAQARAQEAARAAELGETARGVDPVVAAGVAVGAGPIGVLGAIGAAAAIDPLAERVDEEAERAEVELAAAEQAEQLAAQSRAELADEQRRAARALDVAEGVHTQARVATERADAAQRASREQSGRAESDARELRESLAVDTRLVRPATGEVSSHFGTRRHPVTGVVKPHTGIDFRLGDGAAYAAAAGTVASVERDPSYGLLVVVAHGTVDGAAVTTAYAHLAGADVAAGQQVEPGQRIGDIGSTGLSTGPHLHFEIRVADEAVDPAGWLGS